MGEQQPVAQHGINRVGDRAALARTDLGMVVEIARKHDVRRRVKTHDFA